MQQAIEDSEITDDLSDYQKILQCYRWVAENVIYDDNYWHTDWEIVILNKKGICQSYTGLFNGFMLRFNFKTQNNHEIQGHVFNDVWYNGAWYTVDCTWEIFELPEEESTDTLNPSIDTCTEEESSKTEIVEEEVIESEETESEIESEMESEEESEIESEEESESETKEDNDMPTVSGNDVIVEEPESEEEEIE